MPTKLTIDWQNRNVFLDEQPDHAQPCQPARVAFTCFYRGGIFTGENMKVIERVGVLLLFAIAAITDAFGNPLDVALAKISVLESSDETIATASFNEAGQIQVNSTGKAGKVQITLRGDSDPTTPDFFIGIIDIEFLPGEAKTVEFARVDVATANTTAETTAKADTTEQLTDTSAS